MKRLTILSGQVCLLWISCHEQRRQTKRIKLFISFEFSGKNNNDEQRRQTRRIVFRSIKDITITDDN